MDYPEKLNTIDPELHYKQLCEAEAKLRVRNGQKKYAFEYMKLHAGKFVKQGDLLLFCDSRRAEDTNGKHKNFKDNSRQVEQMRKDKLPLEWDEVYVDGNLWFRYDPSVKERYVDDIIAQHEHKSESFNRELIKSKLQETNHKCEITGIPFRSSTDANADHFIPREKGGLSSSDNCVIINSYLNTSKNNIMPIEWFCKTLLTNFLSVCKRVSLLDDAKLQLKQFIDEF